MSHVLPRAPKRLLTVGTHRTNISTKLGLHGNDALIQFAIEHRSEL